jgi:diazepam-binding inhibitor (GABA receptor modulator, acyl-CoA-binding protein)
VMGTVSIPAFFSPANVARITGSQSNAERPTPAVRDSAPAGELAVRFAAAASAAQRLPHRPDNATQLKLYALYKQSTAGDAEEREPEVANFVARAKHGAWAALRGTTHEEAMRRYADLVESLQEGVRRSVNEPALK